MLACLSVQGHTAQVHAASAYTSIVLDGLWVMTLDTSRRNAFQHDAGLEIWLGDESIDGATVPPIVLRWTQSLFEYPATVRDTDAGCLHAAYATVRP